MLDQPQGNRPPVESFDFAGGRVTVIDPSGLLAGASSRFEPILQPGSFPAPLSGVAILLAGSVQDGERVLRFQGSVRVAGVVAPEGGLHPAITGVAYVVPVIDALTRLLAPGRHAGEASSPDEEADPAARPPGIEDHESGLVGTIVQGRPGFDGRVVDTVHAEVAADLARPEHLQGFVRMVFDVARRRAGRPADETFLAGRTYLLSRQVSTAVAHPAEIVRLDQLGGLDDVVQQLREVADSFNHPEAMARWGARRPQGILMSGPPGTGKTTLAKALATEIGGTLKEIRTPDILAKWVGASERNIKKIFTEARRYRTPTVLLFDEFDSIISYTGSPQGAADQAINSVAGIFKQEMNTLVDENPNVIVVATTNFPERVDESLTRSGRFDIKISVPLPDARGRAEILTAMIRRLVGRHETDGFRMFAADVDVDELAASAVGMSGADLKELLRRVQLAKAMQEARGGGVVDAITQDDLLQGIARMHRRA
jgi:transitional endoplasmic reticulum ATPase